MKTLRDVKIGETVKVVKLHGEGPIKRRIMDMGITNKAFDSYEQGLIRDVIAARIPSKLDRSRLFTD